MASWKKRKRSFINPISMNTESTGGYNVITFVTSRVNKRKKDKKAKRKNRISKQKVSRETLKSQKSFDIENAKVLQDQKNRFNLTDKRKKEIDEKRRNTFQEKYGIFGEEYDAVTTLLGNDLYKMLKETQYLDSNQIMDLVFDYNGVTDKQHMEKALLDLIGKINSEYSDQIKRIETVMQFGYSYSEAEKIVQPYLKNEYTPIKGYAKLMDILDDELGLYKKREDKKQELWDKWENVESEVNPFD